MKDRAFGYRKGGANDGYGTLMPNCLAAFRQADLTKTPKAALSDGLKPSRIKIEPSTGRIVIIMQGEPQTPTADAYYAWKAKHDARRT